MADTIASQDTHRSSPGQPSAAAPAPADTRRATVLPRIEWKDERVHIESRQRDRYEELARLGQGGMGEVVLARDNDIERDVAVKRLPGACDADLVRRFVEEIRTVGTLEHPGIPPVHDVGIDEAGRYFFVMKRLHGETLEALIERLKRGDREAHAEYPFLVRVQLFQRAVEAVAYAHGKGVIHRDLKPGNIMIGPYGEVTVLDWGLARKLGAARPEATTATGAAAKPPPDAPATQRGSLAPTLTPGGGTPLGTQLGAVLGTPLYMSPEQARGEHDKLDARSDLYSLCVVFHEFLSLRHYLEGKQSMGDVLQGVQTVVPSPHDLRSVPGQAAVPAAFMWFLHKGLQKDPAKRWQSAEEILGELERIQAGQCRIQCPRTAMRRMAGVMTNFGDDHPRTAMVGGVVLIATVLASLVFSLKHLLF